MRRMRRKGAISDLIRTFASGRHKTLVAGSHLAFWRTLSVADAVMTSRLAPGDTLTGVRLTEFWERMEQALGAGYYASWAQDHVLPELGGRTVNQALAQGESAKAVWLAVFANLGLPARYR